MMHDATTLWPYRSEIRVIIFKMKPYKYNPIKYDGQNGPASGQTNL